MSLPRFTLHKTAGSTSITHRNFGPPSKWYLLLQSKKPIVVHHIWVLTIGDRQYPSPSFRIFRATIRSKHGKIGTENISQLFRNLWEISEVRHASRSEQTANREYTRRKESKIAPTTEQVAAIEPTLILQFNITKSKQEPSYIASEWIHRRSQDLSLTNMKRNSWISSSMYRLWDW